MKAFLRMVWRVLVNGRWRVVRTGWPYKHGYGTYNYRKNTLLDFGLSREQAVRSAKSLNWHGV